MNRNKLGLVLLSGGQDSTTVAYYAKHQHGHIHAITFDYGQKHAIEIQAARIIAGRIGVESHEIISVGPVLKGRSPLIDGSSPAQYESWQKLPGGLESTFVPCRNALFLTIAVNRAYVLDLTDVYIGVSQEDFGGYPDCREVFLAAMEAAMISATTLTSRDPMMRLRFHAPLLDRDKRATVELALSLPDCYAALALTHTAYDGVYPPTGKDHASLLRAKGFELAGWPDPLVMRAYYEGLMQLPTTDNYSPANIARHDVKVSESIRVV